MDDTDNSRIRKRLMSDQVSMTGESAGEIDIARRAALAYWSEDPNHPLEHLLDRHYGPGATRCVSVGSSARRRCAWKSGRIATALTGRC